mmetsp:Transcript_33424/g.88006  ORF Transcript_33424/g.88006 Transcript_33424/m.88006 type:complete len:434 (+) Transcript_33424:75-1376(+)
MQQKLASVAASTLTPTRILDQKLTRNFTVVLALAVLGIVIAVAEVYRLWAHGGEPDAMCEVLKLLVSFFTFWQLAFLLSYYQRKFEQLKATNALLPQDTRLSSGIFVSLRGWSLLPEAFLCVIHPLPFLCFEVTLPYWDLRRGTTLPTTMNTDELATVVMMFARLVLFVRYLPYIAGLTAKSARAYANFNHMALTTSLSVRVEFQRNPVKLLSGTTILLLALFAFTLQVAERRVNEGLDEFGNCLWLATVSMTGLGFGDFYPQTSLGRTTSSLAFAWGALLAALLVMTVIRSMELSNSEIRVNNLIEGSEARSRLKQSAALYIQAAWAAYLERLQRSQTSMVAASLLGNEPLHADPKFCRSMRRFRELRKELMRPPDLLHLLFQEVLDTRTRVEHRLSDVEQKLDEMDAKFEHNIAAMNELLQKNLKYLKHLS